MESSPAEQQFMKRLNEIIDANLHNENFGVSELASELGMSRTTLHRKVKAVIKKSVSTFIREARLERAKKLLVKKDGTVSEIAFKVGFGSVPYFVRAFHQTYGCTPGDVLKGVCTKEILEKGEKKKRLLLKAKKSLIYIIPIVIIVVFSIGFLRLWNQSNPSEQTLVVLPFSFENQNDKVNQNAKWILKEIVHELERIEDITTIPYPLLEKYFYKDKSVGKIAKELKVRYVLFSEFVLSEDNIKISFDLVDGKTEESVWNEIYDDYLNTESVGEDFGLHEKVTLNVVSKVKGKISQEDKEQITRSLSKNKTALEKYYMALNMANKPGTNRDDILQRIRLLEEAIKLDSTFAEAYASLALIYAGNLWYTPYLELAASYLDSAKMYYDKALFYDPKNPKALRGLWKYYRLKGMDDKARDLEHHLPVFVENYLLYRKSFAEESISYPSEKLKQFYKYLEVLPEDVPTPWWMVHQVYYIYMRLGYPELARKYANEEWLIRFSNPLKTNSFHNSLIAELNGNYDSAQVFLQKSDQNQLGNKSGYLMLAARNCMRNRDYETACVYLDSMEYVNPDWLNMLSHGGSRLIYPFGYSYIKTGKKEKGEYHLKGLINRYEKEIEQNFTFALDQITHFELALAWSALGNKEKSLQTLKQLTELGGCQLWFILELENNPMFDAIRGSEEYDYVLKEFNKNYQREHQRIKELVLSMGLEPV